MVGRRICCENGFNLDAAERSGGYADCGRGSSLSEGIRLAAMRALVVNMIAEVNERSVQKFRGLLCA